MQKKRILFVAMQNSPHAARWINQLDSDEWEIFLYPISSAEVHPDLRGVTLYKPSRIVWFIEGVKSFLSNTFFKVLRYLRLSRLANSAEEKVNYVLSLINAIYDQINTFSYVPGGPKISKEYGPNRLAKCIAELSPDIVHSLEFQHCGYCVLAASKILEKRMPAWAASNWGSDIFFYEQFPEDRFLINQILHKINYYFSECQRDIDLALTFNPNLAPCFLVPAAGGFDLDALARLRSVEEEPSHRRLIMVKGYESFAGRALDALAALKVCVEDLQGFRVLVYSASHAVRDEVGRMKKMGLINIDVLEKTSPNRMMQLFCQSRVYLGVSISDGISISMLEAMAGGAFPIQTNTSCCEEWIVNNQSGFIISPYDPSDMAHKIQIALRDDNLVNCASKLNLETVSTRLDKSKITKRVQEIYQEMADRELLG